MKYTSLGVAISCVTTAILAPARYLFYQPTPLLTEVLGGCELARVAGGCALAAYRPSSRNIRLQEDSAHFYKWHRIYISWSDRIMCTEVDYASKAAAARIKRKSNSINSRKHRDDGYDIWINTSTPSRRGIDQGLIVKVARRTTSNIEIRCISSVLGCLWSLQCRRVVQQLCPMTKGLNFLYASQRP
jgi:hypothetical protein